jgi:hypothetical protein
VFFFNGVKARLDLPFSFAIAPHHLPAELGKLGQGDRGVPADRDIQRLQDHIVTGPAAHQHIVHRDVDELY